MYRTLVNIEHMFSTLLSPKQTEILNYIISHIEEAGYPPSIRDIGKGCNIFSSGSVSIHLDALIKKGYIERISNIPRGIKVLRKPDDPEKKVKISIIGEIAAGRPIIADQQISDYSVEIDQSRVPVGRKLFALTVKGDSMIGENIYDGDIVIIAEQITARNGDIVVALIGEEATLKKFQRVGDYIALLPANPQYDPIPIISHQQDLRIQGKLVVTVTKQKN